MASSIYGLHGLIILVHFQEFDYNLKIIAFKLMKSLTIIGRGHGDSQVDFKKNFED